nr:MFS-type transporter SLC18B1-like [Onthophagus taurus]XP_022912871.1 MFS-type transporter SLC18B1-like [Onthophagus taurus]
MGVPTYTKNNLSSCSKDLQDSFTVSFSSSSSSGRCIPRSRSLANFTQYNYAPGELRRLRERLMRLNSRVETSTLKKLDKSQIMTLISLAVVDFMCFCSMSILAPFFPREAAAKGLSPTMSGFVFSFHALVVFITAPIFGKILPKLGARSVFLSGIFFSGICNILFGLLEFVNDYTLFTSFCFLIRGLEALGASAFSTASYVYVVATFPDNMGSVFGILETFVGLGMSIGPALGGFLYSIGGFEAPFFVLGATMVCAIPINMFLLKPVEHCDVSNQNTSMLSLVKVPAVLVIGLVIVVTSSAWAFLDPTLEPHLREFDLSPEHVGLIFLLFSALYGIFSPIWGWLADRVFNHWHMMALGLIFSSFGLLLLGPSPLFNFLPNSLPLNLVALSIIGISVALSLLPTFQGVLTSAIEGGYSNAIPTYGIVAGIWSCMYSLGEVIGPSLGGILLEHYGFAVASTTMAGSTFILGISIWIFYFIRRKMLDRSLRQSSNSESFWDFSDSSESSPLLLSQTHFDHNSYTQEKVMSFEKSRKFDSQCGEFDVNQVTDVRGTISITSRGACEV